MEKQKPCHAARDCAIPPCPEETGFPAQMMKPEHGIIRSETDDAWYVKSVKNNVSPKAFFDVVYGNSIASYAMARIFNRSLRPYRDEIRNHKQPSRSKKNPKLPVGISLTNRIQVNKGGKGEQLIYNFKVSCPGTQSKTVYIGTEMTWKQNYEAALKKAMIIRERAKQSLLKDKQE